MGVRNTHQKRNEQNSEPDRFSLERPETEPTGFQIDKQTETFRYIIDVRLWMRGAYFVFYVFSFKLQTRSGDFIPAARIDTAHGSIHSHILRPDGENLEPLTEITPYTESNWKKTLESHYDRLYAEYVDSPQFITAVHERWKSHGWL